MYSPMVAMEVCRGGSWLAVGRAPGGREVLAKGLTSLCWQHSVNRRGIAPSAATQLCSTLQPPGPTAFGAKCYRGPGPPQTCPAHHSRKDNIRVEDGQAQAERLQAGSG